MATRYIAAAMALLVCAPARLGAQTPRWTPLIEIGSDVDDRMRLDQLLGRRAPATYVQRSTSELSGELPGPAERPRWAPLAPAFAATWNSSLPFSLNDGAMWAGRGWSTRLRAGLRVQSARVSLVLAPEVLTASNFGFDMPHPVAIPIPSPDRHPLASPWHQSIDAPLRFGYRPFAQVDPGQSVLAVRAGAITLGVSTEDEWWGPGIRNAIVLSNNAPGIPRLFVRTRGPIHTAIGAVQARWFLGALFESDYFDATPLDDRRAISGLALAWTPDWEPDLTIGFTRAVYASVDRWSTLALHALDFLRGRSGDRDQIFSFFGRWVFPADGFAAHFEWARTEPPTSLRDFLAAPTHSQGYTLGIEWARPVRAGAHAIRFQGEVSYLEQSATYRIRPTRTFYTSPMVPQGYTQRGQVIGAAIGPGASSQWLGLDYVAPAWRLGVFAGRIRWDEDGLYTFPNVYNNKFCAHDVSIFAGLAAAWASRFGRIEAKLGRGERLNVFFHNLTWCAPDAPRYEIRDARNTTLEIRLSPP